MNTVWIGNAQAAFAALYGKTKAAAVCAAVVPGVMKDFRRMLEAAAEGGTVRETYRLDDGRGEVSLAGCRESDGLYLTALSVGGRSVDLGEPRVRL